MDRETSPENLATELAAILAAELAAGNRIAECGPSMAGTGGVMVLLQYPFRATPQTLPPGVAYREINDPHWWKAEYVHTPSADCLACRF